VCGGVGGKIVEAAHVSARVTRIERRRIGVAPNIEAQRLAQCRETAVVEEHAPRRDVAQRRHLERAAQIAAFGEIGAIGAAKSEVEVAGVRRRRNARVTWNAEIVVAEVGEERQLAVRAASAAMTRRAVPLVRAVEQRESAKLRQ